MAESNEKVQREQNLIVNPTYIYVNSLESSKAIGIFVSRTGRLFLFLRTLILPTGRTVICLDGHVHFSDGRAESNRRVRQDYKRENNYFKHRRLTKKDR
jgi:hypothetical protein